MAPRKRPVPAPPAFTLVEVIVVIVVLGILAVSAVPAVTSLSASRAAMAGRLIAGDLRYARERALQTGARTWVTFSAPATVALLTEQPSNPGRASAVPISDPGGSGAWTDTLDSGAFAGVTISAAWFDGSSDVGFDARGRPLNHTESPLASDGAVALTGGATVVVKSGTGLVTGP